MLTSSTRVLAAVLLVAVVTAACGGDDDASSTETTGASDPTAAEPEPTAAGTESTAAEPEPTAAGTESSAAGTESPGAELTDSHRGVTADAIKLGVLLLDLEKLRETAGVELKWGDNEGQYREAIATINDNGGILGRMIDPVYIHVDPLSETGYQEACVQLTEDEQVFAVIGFVRPAESALCYTETGDTPFVGYLTDITSDVPARSVLPVISSNPLPERLDTALVDVVADTGALDGKTIAILGKSEDRNQLTIDALAERGYEVVDATVTNQPTDDAAADAAELDVVIERWSSLGVDYVLDTTGLDRVLAAANRAGFQADWASNDGTILSLSRFESGATEAEVARTVVVNEPSVEVIYESGHELTVACVDNWNEKRPDEPAVFYPGLDDVDNLQRIARSCNQVQTFAMIAERAGPELTTESFAAALAEMGSYEVAMQPLASLDTDKWDAGDAVTLYSWDPEQQDFVAGEFIDIG